MSKFTWEIKVTVKVFFVNIYKEFPKRQLGLTLTRCTYSSAKPAYRGFGNRGFATRLPLKKVKLPLNDVEPNLSFCPRKVAPRAATCSTPLKMLCASPPDASEVNANRHTWKKGTATRARARAHTFDINASVPAQRHGAIADTNRHAPGLELISATAFPTSPLGGGAGGPYSLFFSTQADALYKTFKSSVMGTNHQSMRSISTAEESGTRRASAIKTELVIWRCRLSKHGRPNPFMTFHLISILNVACVYF